jgi:hypothetical protein
VRQNFNVQVEFFPYARLGTAANGNNINVDLDPLLYLNQFDGAKLVQVHVDGIITRFKKLAKNVADKVSGFFSMLDVAPAH